MIHIWIEKLAAEAKEYFSSRFCLTAGCLLGATLAAPSAHAAVYDLTYSFVAELTEYEESFDPFYLEALNLDPDYVSPDVSIGEQVTGSFGIVLTPSSDGSYTLDFSSCSASFVGICDSAYADEWWNVQFDPVKGDLSGYASYDTGGYFFSAEISFERSDPFLWIEDDSYYEDSNGVPVMGRTARFDIKRYRVEGLPRPHVIPLPAAITLLPLGVAALFGMSRRKNRTAAR